MTRDIADLLAGAVEERAEELLGLRPTPAAFALTRVRIRRRRIVRHTVQAGVGVAASGVVAAGVWFGTQLDRSPAPPAQTPPTATPTPGPTTTPTPAPTQAPPAPIREPGQPAALPAPADLVEGMGDGWVLAIYRSDPPDSDPTVITSQVLYAIAPDGTVYRLAGIAENQVLKFLDWQAGEDRALVAYGPPASEYAGTAWLDLRTGAVSDPVQSPAGSLFVAALDDGTLLWQTAAEGQPVELHATTAGGSRLVGPLGDQAMTVLLSPSQNRVATMSGDTRQLISLPLDGSPGRTVDLGEGQMCTLLGWLDDASVLVQCFDSTGGDRVVDWHPHLSTVNVGTGAVAQVATLGVGQPFAPTYGQGGTGLGDGRVAFPAATLDDQLPTAQPCVDSVWRWSSDGLERLWGMDGTSSDGMTLGTSAGSLLVEARPGCMSGLGSDELVAVAADGGVRVVAPAPDPVGGVAWLTDITWAPAR